MKLEHADDFVLLSGCAPEFMRFVGRVAAVFGLVMLPHSPAQGLDFATAGVWLMLWPTDGWSFDPAGDTVSISSRRPWQRWRMVEAFPSTTVQSIGIEPSPTGYKPVLRLYDGATRVLRGEESFHEVDRALRKVETAMRLTRRDHAGRPGPEALPRR